MLEINESADGLKKTFESLKSPLKSLVNDILAMNEGAEALNQAFVQNGIRLDEMADAVARSASGVIRLGGKITDVSSTMIQIASGARRNVIATEEQVSKIFAAIKILGGSSSDLVENFGNVGISINQIGTNLEDSIEYIQSIGLNAREVMTSVGDKMEKMNRYQFEGGVLGLSKMAAQASMLRFDMQETFTLADKVLDPDKAIEVASAFQRLGVSVGNLTDPFALMNQSINDPSGLQNSLVEVAKTFTQFDEKTKTFKINPQGVLTLREIQNQTGVSAAEMSKLGLAAADLDRRLSKINLSLDFENEDDKKFIANMATMDKSGEYIVQLKNDSTGEVDKIKLSELTNEELRALRIQQENAPKDLEDIQTRQLGIQDNILSTIRGNMAKGTFGIAGSTVVRDNLIGAGRVSRAVSDSIDDKIPQSAIISEKINDAVDKMSQLYREKDLNNISAEDFTQKISSLKADILKGANSLGKEGSDAFYKIMEESSKKITGTSTIEKEFKKFTQSITNTDGKITSNERNIQSRTNDKGLSDVLGSRVENPKKSTTSNKTSSGDTTKTKVEFGEIKITIDTPPGTTVSQQQLNNIFNNQQFKEYVSKVVKQVPATY